MWGGKAARSARHASKTYSSPSTRPSSSTSSTRTDSDRQGWDDARRIESKVKSSYSEWGTYLDSCDFYYDGGHYIKAYITILINPSNTNLRSAQLLEKIKRIISNIDVARKYQININLETRKW